MQNTQFNKNNRDKEFHMPNIQFTYNYKAKKPEIQYTKIYDCIMKNPVLRSTSKLVYARLIYRTRLSIINSVDKTKSKNKIYYDKKRKCYYVIYKKKDLEDDIGSGKHAVANALNQLENLGLLIRYPTRWFSRVKELVLPYFNDHTFGLGPHESTKTGHSRTKTLKTKKAFYSTKYGHDTIPSSHQSNFNLCNNNTSHTARTHARKITKQSTHSKYVMELERRQINQEAAIKTDCVKQLAAHKQKTMGLTKPVTDVLAFLAGSSKTALSNIIHEILKAKKHVLRQFREMKYMTKKRFMERENTLFFETNDYFLRNGGHTFANKIRFIFRQSLPWHNERVTKSSKKYRMASLINMFRDASYYALPPKNLNPNEPTIPIFKI